LLPGKPVLLVLKISNPTGHDTVVQFQPAADESQDNLEVKSDSEEVKTKAQEVITVQFYKSKC
jgi:hypothetical protein